jgi:site-specific DNA-methyltransferase (adenine-specific)
MTIESTDLQNSTNPAITYSECYAQVFLGDCLEQHKHIKSGSVDLILTDLPYGIITMKENAGNYKKLNTGEKWDSVIDTKKIFQIANRILRKNGKLILFSQEPFSFELMKEQTFELPFIYKMYWEKNDFANALGVNKAPVSYMEEILIFNQKFDSSLSNPIRRFLKEMQDDIDIYYNSDEIINLYYNSGIASSIESAKTIAKHKLDWNYKQIEPINKTHWDLLNTVYQFPISFEELTEMNDKYCNSTFNLWEGNKYKSNILKYKKDYNGYHPTQKPILLLEDLIKTFSNEGNLVVDLTMGSGSTGVACKNTNRNFIGIEKDEGYFKIAEQRINARTLFS